MEIVAGMFHILFVTELQGLFMQSAPVPDELKYAD